MTTLRSALLESFDKTIEENMGIMLAFNVGFRLRKDNEIQTSPTEPTLPTLTVGKVGLKDGAMISRVPWS